MRGLRYVSVLTDTPCCRCGRLLRKGEKAFSRHTSNGDSTERYRKRSARRRRYYCGECHESLYFDGYDESDIEEECWTQTSKWSGENKWVLKETVR